MNRVLRRIEPGAGARVPGRLAEKLLLTIAFFALVAVAAADDVKKTEWNGHEMLQFKVGGRSALLVVPKTPAPGKPWIWRTEFFGIDPQADVALLGKGLHVAYLDVGGLFGAPVALDAMDEYCAHVRKTYGLSAKPALEGFSRGGLYAFNWAARHPDQVACLYVDAPVCDFKSWPGGKGRSRFAGREWRQLLQAYRMTDEQARAYKLNPVDNLAPLAKAKIPILSVIGDMHDWIVPIEENTLLVETRYKELGGDIQVIKKPKAGHRPHSLPDPTPIVNFVVKHTTESGAKAPAPAPAPSKPAPQTFFFLGDSITKAGGYVRTIKAELIKQNPENPPQVHNFGHLSETVSNLSEAYHPGRRPCALNWVDAVFAEKPNFVVICYGINDGIYHPFNEKRFAAYQAGIETLIKKSQAAGAYLIILTPPPFAAAGPPFPPGTNAAAQETLLAKANAEAEAAAEKDPKKFGYRSAYPYYDQVLARYCKWLLTLDARAGVSVVDIRTPMLARIKETHGSDAIHPNARGHAIIAETFLKQWPAIQTKAKAKAL